MQPQEEVICHIRCEQGLLRWTFDIWRLQTCFIRLRPWIKHARMHAHTCLDACVASYSAELQLHTSAWCAGVILLWAAYTWTLEAGLEQIERAKSRHLRSGRAINHVWRTRIDLHPPPHLHAVNGPLTQLLSNNTPWVNPHLSYGAATTLLRCLRFACATRGHNSAIPIICLQRMCLLGLAFRLQFIPKSNFAYFSLSHAHSYG